MSLKRKAEKTLANMRGEAQPANEISFCPAIRSGVGFNETSLKGFKDYSQRSRSIIHKLGKGGKDQPREPAGWYKGIVTKMMVEFKESL